MKFHHSIRLKYSLIMAGVLLGVLAGLFALVNLGMESFATKKKQLKVKDAITKIEAYADSEWDDTYVKELNRYCATENLSISIYAMENFRMEMIYSSNYNMDSFFGRLKSYMEGAPFNADQILEKEEIYFLYKVYDPQMDNIQIECLGEYEENFYMISTSVQGIKESVAVTNQYLLRIGFIAIVLGTLVSYLVSRTLAKPIERLSNLSSRIALLDFEGRYEGKQKNEIGQLGENMNDMSARLQSTIRELQAANAQLEIDIKERERIDEARKEFLANVSHELKTPIALVQGYAEGLREGIADADAESRAFYCDVIVDEAQKMNTIVKRLLNLDEIESGQVEPVMEEFDLREVLKALIQPAGMLGKGKSIETELIAPEPIPVIADEFMIEQVMQNYLSNAFHHVSDPGKITVRVERTGEAQNGEQRTRVSVYNTGEEIPEQDLQRIWEKFYKVDKARTRAYGGSGIGLSIVSAIIDKHGGRCGVANRDGGVEFWFELSTPHTRAGDD